MEHNCIEEVCFHMESKYSSIFCTDTTYLVLCLHRKLGKSEPCEISHCIESIFFFFLQSKLQASLFAFLLRNKKKCIKGKFFPMPTPCSFSPTPLPIWNSFLPSAMKDDALCSHHSESKIHRFKEREPFIYIFVYICIYTHCNDYSVKRQQETISFDRNRFFPI